MWLPSNEPEFVANGSLKRSHLPSLGYLRVLDKGNETVLFIKDEKIVGAWHLDVESLEEFYENKAIKSIIITSESKVELYKMEIKLFETIIELNEETKLSLPIEIDFILVKYNINKSVDRDELLEKYKIREPSQKDVETLINEYTK